MCILQFYATGTVMPTKRLYHVPIGIAPCVYAILCATTRTTRTTTRSVVVAVTTIEGQLEHVPTDVSLVLAATPHEPV